MKLAREKMGLTNIELMSAFRDIVPISLLRADARDLPLQSRSRAPSRSWTSCWRPWPSTA